MIQGGAGTSTYMNTNEVIADIVLEPQTGHCRDPDIRSDGPVSDPASD